MTYTPMSNLISKLADVTSTWGNLQCHKGCLPDLQPLSIAWTGEGDKIVKAVWSRSLTCYPVDSWLTLAGRWRLDRIGTMASSNAVLVRRQVRGAVSRNLRDPHRSHTNREQGSSQWESSWAPGCPQGMWAGEIVGHVQMLTFSLLIVADACWFRGATKRART